MARRFNYTHRRKLSGQHVTARLISEDPPVAVATLDLSEAGLDAGAQVFLEAYVGNISRRIDCGTVARLDIPESIDLRDLSVGGTIQFRVKVVGDGGRLVASADRIRLAGASEESDRKPLLTVETTPDLGEEIWRIEVSPTDHPRLLLNSRVPAIEDRLVNDPVLGGAILLPAIRKVLECLIEEMDGDVWQADWVTFVRSFRPDTDPQKLLQGEIADEWIDDILSVFATQHRFARRAIEVAQ